MPTMMSQHLGPLFMAISNAKAYSTLSKPQYELGCNFVRTLNLSEGDKVLDMGCGTGEVTAFIANVVGRDGEVVGVDPDETRVNIGQEKFKDVANVDFQVGSSLIGFPHDNEEYYDVQFSSKAFQWLKQGEKKCYLRKAYQCLKAGGRIAILTGLKESADLVPPGIANAIHLLGEGEYKELVRGAGFNNIDTQVLSSAAYFASFEEFAAWFKASSKLEEMDQEWLKAKTVTEPNGRIRFDIKHVIYISATK